MELVHQRCAGVDVPKRDAKVCVRVAGAGRRKTSSTVTTWGAMTNQVLALRDHLIAAQVTLVVMEATSDYWKPFYYLLEDGPFEVMLVNARHAKNMPGRKTDVSDAAWLAELGAHGLVRASFVPPEPIRQLRDLTRARTTITRERAHEIQRLEKLLEDAGIKLSAVASDISGVSGRAMLEALIEGERDPAVLAELAKRRLRSKIPPAHRGTDRPLRRAHGFLARVHLDLIDSHSRAIEELTRIVTRRGQVKAIVAIEHTMLIAIWYMLSTGAFYDDPGGDFYTHLNPDRAKKRALDQLHNMGYNVTLEPLAVAG